MTDMRIRLKPKGDSMQLSGDLFPLSETQGMLFMYTPTITWQGAVNYSQMQIVHSLQDYYFFSNCASPTLQISGKFTAQNESEAKYTYACMHFLRSATKMRFGNSTPLGLPPPVLQLNGYGNVMKSLNCVVQNYSIDYPDNVDYVSIQTTDGEAFIPVLTTLSVTLIIQNTPAKLRKFDFDKFAVGTELEGWF